MSRFCRMVPSNNIGSCGMIVTESLSLDKETSLMLIPSIVILPSLSGNILQDVNIFVTENISYFLLKYFTFFALIDRFDLWIVNCNSHRNRNTHIVSPNFTWVESARRNFYRIQFFHRLQSYVRHRYQTSVRVTHHPNVRRIYTLDSGKCWLLFEILWGVNCWN